MKQKKQILLLALPTLVVLLILFIGPMVLTFVRSLFEDGLEYYIKFFTDTFYLKILWNTVLLSVKCVVLTLVLGYPAAYFLAKAKGATKTFLLIATIFPFLVSAVTRAYGWMILLGDRGIINEILIAIGIIKDPIQMMYTEVAVLVGMGQLLLPYMILAITSVIQSIDENLVYASYSLGCRPAKTFFKVILPLSSPGILSGCILVFTLSMTSYVTPQLLGGAQYLTVTTLIYNQVKTVYNLPFANAICYILVFAILIFQILSNRVTKSVNARLGDGKNA